MIATKTKIKIGPRHHGRHMSLRAFEFAPVEEGYTTLPCREIFEIAPEDSDD